MILTNKPDIEGKIIKEELGLVGGSIVNSRFFIRDFFAGIRKFLGREVIEYTELLNKGREKATERMIKQAEDLDANAIVNIRFQTSQITGEAAEIYVYGTAVKVA